MGSEVMSAVCACGCGKSRWQKRIGPSYYQVYLDGKFIGFVQKRTQVIERYRPGLYCKDTYWYNSANHEQTPTRHEAIENVLIEAHLKEANDG